MKPKVFISYSWSTQAHREFVIGCAERLLADGVNVIIDAFDLKEGHEKYKFMERMVTDETVTHVLIFSDKSYAQKANSVKASGVNTESQIISKGVYDKVEQSKFIPLVCEFDSDGQPYLPVFLQSRIWVNFSSPEQVNHHWEGLLRLLYGKPLRVKPEIGPAPAYIEANERIPSSPITSKYESLRLAIQQEKKALKPYRRAFFEACYAYADKLRIRTSPNQEGKNFGERVLQDCTNLVHVRDKIVDWILLESETIPSTEFNESLIELFESIRELKSRPIDVTTWSEHWFEAHKLFAYELFLYVVAALLKTESYESLHEIYTTHFFSKNETTPREERFERFDTFYAYSQLIAEVLAPPGRKLHSGAAELVKRQAQRTDIPFREIMQADMLTLMVAFTDKEVRWYPQTMYYSSFSREFPFFIRASQHKHFLKLAIITGINNADELRTAVLEGHKRLEVNRWTDFMFERTFENAMNLRKLDTIK